MNAARSVALASEAATRLAMASQQRAMPLQHKRNSSGIWTRKTRVKKSFKQPELPEKTGPALSPEPGPVLSQKVDPGAPTPKAEANQLPTKSPKAQKSPAKGPGRPRGRGEGTLARRRPCGDPDMWEACANNYLGDM